MFNLKQPSKAQLFKLGTLAAIILIAACSPPLLLNTFNGIAACSPPLLLNTFNGIDKFAGVVNDINRQ